MILPIEEVRQNVDNFRISFKDQQEHVNELAKHKKPHK